jgi:hypothetical protein
MLLRRVERSGAVSIGCSRRTGTGAGIAAVLSAVYGLGGTAPNDGSELQP